MTFRCCNHQALAKSFGSRCGVYRRAVVNAAFKMYRAIADKREEQSAQRRYSYKEDFPRSAA